MWRIQSFLHYVWNGTFSGAKHHRKNVSVFEYICDLGAYYVLKNKQSYYLMIFSPRKLNWWKHSFSQSHEENTFLNKCFEKKLKMSWNFWYIEIELSTHANHHRDTIYCNKSNSVLNKTKEISCCAYFSKCFRQNYLTHSPHPAKRNVASKS